MGIDEQTFVYSCRQLGSWPGGAFSLYVYTKISMHSTWLSHWLKCFIKAAPFYWTNNLTKDGKKDLFGHDAAKLSFWCMFVDPLFWFLPLSFLPLLISNNAKMSWFIVPFIAHNLTTAMTASSFGTVTSALLGNCQNDTFLVLSVWRRYRLGVKSITVMEYWYF